MALHVLSIHETLGSVTSTREEVFLSGWGCISLVEHLLRMHAALGSIPSTPNEAQSMQCG